MFVFHLWSVDCCCLIELFWCERSNRELGKGDEVAWYADGDYTVKNEYNPSIAYGFGEY